MSWPRIVERACVAEAAGFDSLWLMDHLAAPMTPEVDTFEAWTVATALAAQTAEIRIGHLTLCDPFRHPAVLAKMAATLDVISTGRLDLGLGWGSVPRELAQYGIAAGSARERAARLRETLDVLGLMFAGEPFSYAGSYVTMEDAIGRPVPVQPKVPIHIGGGGEKLTMPLVAQYADWWNCPGYALDRLDALRPLAGSERVSVQHPIGVAFLEEDRDAVIELTNRRFGSWGGVIAGTVDEVIAALCAEVERGVEGFICQFWDFGSVETIERFALQVIPAVREHRC
jgi:alkanesulfonate monooxygenase SsuD/methylene tetrahydromethanopterin reductase-like flavin-dependent oxidoreductase (luciferase family)